MHPIAKFLRPTARQIMRGDRSHYFAGGLIRKAGAQFSWACPHHHDTRSEALACARSALNCESGSPTESQLDAELEYEQSKRADLAANGVRAAA